MLVLQPSEPKGSPSPCRSVALGKGEGGHYFCSLVVCTLATHPYRDDEAPALILVETPLRQHSWGGSSVSGHKLHGTFCLAYRPCCMSSIDLTFTYSSNAETCHNTIS